MINKIKKLFSKKTSEDAYKISILTQDSKKYILRFKESDTISEKSNFPFQIGIATKVKTNNNGFPSKKENIYLNKIEDAVISAFEGNRSIFLGTITGGGIKEFVLYTKETEKLERIHNQIQNQFPAYKLQMNIQEDKNWDIYKSFVN